MSRKRATQILRRLGYTLSQITDDHVELLAEELDSAAQQWGHGPESTWRILETQRFDDGTSFRVFMGEHPHSRRDNDLYALVDDSDEPVAFDGHRVRIAVEVREFNYLKVSGLTGSTIKKGCEVIIKLDDRQVYSKFRRRASDGLIWAAGHLHRFYEHPVQLWKPPTPNNPWPDLIGRRVFWRDQPAIVSDFYGKLGQVVLSYDADDVRAEGGKGFLRAAHPEGFCPVGPEEVIADDLLSPLIWWFRRPDEALAR